MGRSAIHPGEYLAEQLDALYERRRTRPPTQGANRVTAILNGQRTVTR